MPFALLTKDDTSPGDSAKCLVDVSKTTCHVAKNEDGIWIGDCNNCHKRLGRDCPATLWVRSKREQLDKTLKEMRKAPANKDGEPMQSTRGSNHSALHKGGLCQQKKKRQMHLMASDLGAHLDSLKLE